MSNEEPVKYLNGRECFIQFGAQTPFCEELQDERGEQENREEQLYIYTAVAPGRASREPEPHCARHSTALVFLPVKLCTPPCDQAPNSFIAQ